VAGCFVRSGIIARLCPALSIRVDAGTVCFLDDAGQCDKPDLFFLLLFLSGQIAPLSILPRAVQIAAKILPFYWTIGFPTELLLGKVTVAGAFIGIGVQIVWLVIAVFLVRFVWRLGVKAYSAVGQ